MSDDLTPDQLDELDMELHLRGFEATLDADVQLRESHRVAFRAGWISRKLAVPTEPSQP